MNATEMPGCCALQVIHGIDCLSETDEFSKAEAAWFPKFLAKKYSEEDGDTDSGYYNEIAGEHGLAYITSSVCLISPQGITKREFDRQKKAIKDAGMKLICKFPGEHTQWNGGKYMIEMWGSKNMEVAGAVHRSRSKRRLPKKASRNTAKVAPKRRGA